MNKQNPACLVAVTGEKSMQVHRRNMNDTLWNTGPQGAEKGTWNSQPFGA